MQINTRRVEEVIGACKRRGVTLFVEDGRLGFKPKARMTKGLMEMVKTYQLSIVEELQKSVETDLPADYEARIDFLRRIVLWLASRGVTQIPWDVHEDIDLSAAQDTTEVFKENVRDWAAELAREVA